MHNLIVEPLSQNPGSAITEIFGEISFFECILVYIFLAGSGSLYRQEIRNEDAPNDSTCPSASSLTQSPKAHVRYFILYLYIVTFTWYDIGYL